MDTLLGLCVGLGLAAACGFRVFVPLLVLGLGARAGLVSLGESVSFVSSTPALIALGTASVLEMAAYWIPWVDHALDTVASPAAVVGGTLAAASQFGDMGPFLTWGSALVAGGGTAAAAQALNVTTRGASTVTTGGILNPIISAIQSAIAAVLSVLAVIAPIIAGCLLLAVVAMVVAWWRRRGATTNRRIGARAAAA
ncbi:MAG: DUF4126 domain-containing protein [Phycisphaerae bacterium]|nr:DUF4126 domain-containing protein [Phycisphaerae bacterium]